MTIRQREHAEHCAKLIDVSRGTHYPGIAVGSSGLV